MLLQLLNNCKRLSIYGAFRFLGKPFLRGKEGQISHEELVRMIDVEQRWTWEEEKMLEELHGYIGGTVYFRPMCQDI